MYIINMNTSSKSYPIIIGENILDKINPYIEKYDKILLLTNDKVGPLYKNQFLSNLKRNDIFILEIKDGEKYKTLESAKTVYDFLIENDFTRNSLIITLGGGVICDLGGYVAGTFMRGIDFIQCPTSLLAQVDASIGGKVAVNHPMGKNLIGLFKQPIGVFVNISFLKTLSSEEFKSGLGEIIKHGFISENNNYLDFLNNNISNILNLNIKTLEEMVYISCLIKKSIVEKDEFENGIRAFLNLGHTYGHALETLYNYENISHGEGVAKGIIFAGKISLEKNYINEEKYSLLWKTFENFNIDCHPVYIEHNHLIKIMKKDKKNSHDNINFILFKNDNLNKEPVSIEIIEKANNSFKNRFIKSVIDIGTNSCRLFLGEVEKKDNKINIIKKLYKSVETTRLGEGVNINKKLLLEPMKRTLTVIEKFNHISLNMGATEILAFATSATRDSENKDVFINMVKDKTNINIKCISGELEAKFSFLGNSQIYKEKIMIIDIGGGSTEFSLGENENLEFVKSFNIGVVRANEIFFKNENYSEENISKCQNWIFENLKEIEKFKNEKFKLIGVAGSVTTNVSVLKEMEIYNSNEVHNYNLSIEEIKKNLDLFLSKPLEKRRNIKGLEPKRADVIIGGNIILLSILKLLNKDSITVSESDNLEGGMTYVDISFSSEGSCSRGRI